MADQEESRLAHPILPPPPPSPAILEEEEPSHHAPPMSPPMSPPSAPPPSPAILEEEESRHRAPPMSPPPPPPPSPAIFEDNSSEAIPCGDTEDGSSSSPHTDLISLWWSNDTAVPQAKSEAESLEEVPTLQNFDLESSFPDLVDWNTTSTTITQAPVVTQPLWVQLHSPIGGEVDDASGLALRTQSPQPSILPLPLGIEFPEASLSPLALGIHPPPSSFEMIQAPQASLSPLGLPIQASQTSLGIESVPASFSSLPSNISSTLPITPVVGNLLPNPSPIPERRSWSTFLSTPPPAWRHLLLAHPASSSVSVPSDSHPSHQTHHFLPSANAGHQQEVPDAHAPVGISTPNANSFAGFLPTSQLSWSQAMALWGSWIPNLPWISNGQEMKLPIPRRPQFVVPRVAATTAEPPQLLANFGSSDVGNMPNSNAEEEVPVEGHRRAQTGGSSRRSRKRSKLAVRTDKKLFK